MSFRFDPYFLYKQNSLFHEVKENLNLLSTNKNRPKRQHAYPQSAYSKFSHGNDKFYAYNKCLNLIGKKKIISVIPKFRFYEIDFNGYKNTETIESAFQRIEDVFVKEYNNFCLRNRYFDFNTEYIRKCAISRFLALNILRYFEYKKYITTMFDIIIQDGYDKLQSEDFFIKNSKLNDYPHYNGLLPKIYKNIADYMCNDGKFLDKNSAYVLFIFYTLDYFGKHLYNLQWKIFKSPKDKEFITSDRPIAFFRFGEDEYIYLCREPAFEFRGLNAIWNISPKFSLFMTSNRFDIIDKRALSNEEYFSCANQIILDSSFSEVYSRKELRQTDFACPLKTRFVNYGELFHNGKEIGILNKKSKYLEDPSP